MSALDDAMAAYGGTAPAPDALDTAMTSYAASKPLPPKTNAPLPMKADPSMLSVFGNSLVKGAAGLGDWGGSTLVNLGNLGIAAYGTAAHAITGKADSMPDLIPSDALSGYGKIAAATGLTSPDREPVTPAQKVVDFTGQVIGGGGVNPRAITKAALATTSARTAIPVVRDLVTPVVGGVAGGVTQQAVAAAADPDTWYGRAAAAVLPAAATMGAMVPTAGMGAAAERASQATANVTPAQWAAADALAKKAAALGAPITAAEALQGVTGANPALTTLQRVTEQSGPGVKALAPAMAQRPTQNAALFGKVADGIYPNEPAPDALAGLLQSAASDSITAAQKARSAQASPFYQAQRDSDLGAMNLTDQVPGLSQTVDSLLQSRDRSMQVSGQLSGLQNDMTQAAKDYHPVPGMPGFPARYLPQTDVAVQAGAGAQDARQMAMQNLADANAAQAKLNATSDALAEKNLPAIQGQVQGLLSQLDQQIRVAGPTVEGAHLQAFRNELAPNGQPIVYPSQLESVYRNNRNKLETGPFSSAADRTQAGVLGPQVQSLNDLIQSVSPDIAQGRAAYAAASKAVVDPMKFGQVGKLAQSDNFVNQAATLLPEKPMDVTPGVVANTVQTIGAQNPTIIPRFAAQYLRGAFNESNQRLQGGPNQQGGANFAAKVAGNDTQAQNLTSLLSSSGTNPQGLLDALDVWRAQGTRPAVGSATTFNNGETGLLSGSGSYLSAAGKPMQLPGLLMEKAKFGASTRALADVMLPDGMTVERFQALARANGAYSPMDQAKFAALLRAQSAPQQAEQVQN